MNKGFTTHYICKKYFLQCKYFAVLSAVYFGNKFFHSNYMYEVSIQYEFCEVQKGLKIE
jgi:hypothetical protein